MAQKPFYITTTLPYVNADPHIGHALEFVRADVIARRKRLENRDVFFNTGTDEHGAKIFENAVKEGKEVKEYVTGFSEKFKELHQKLNISYDGFIRTTDERHILAAEEIWKRCSNNGYIYKKNYQAKYCVGCELTKTDSELVDGKCEVHPTREIELIDEENYFFAFSKLQDKLLGLYKETPNFVIPQTRFNEIRSFVERGLEDFSISRLKSKMSWGVPVPGDDTHVMYVWFDALTSYISTLGWPTNESFHLYWEQDQWETRSGHYSVGRDVVQYCGKDNLRQQAAMWQAMLIAADLPTSTQIVIDGFILSGGQKMSKSTGNVINPLEIIEEYSGVTDYPEDVLRFVLLHDISSFEDGDITKDTILTSYVSHLQNGIGNLTNRIMKMATTHAVVSLETSRKESFDIFKVLETFDTRRAMEMCMEEVRNLDKFIQDTEPFKVIKHDEERGLLLIGDCLADLYRIAHNLSIFLPNTSAKILECIEEHKMPEKPLFGRV
jgi:methionyl-tRNA synthetase